MAGACAVFELPLMAPTEELKTKKNFGFCLRVHLLVMLLDGATEDKNIKDGHFFYNHPERGAYFAA